jgi:hypothetical protein
MTDIVFAPELSVHWTKAPSGGRESSQTSCPAALFGPLGDRKLLESISATGSASFPAANTVNDMDMDYANAATFIMIRSPGM